jgi:Family of unknown function (DUF6464)
LPSAIRGKKAEALRVVLVEATKNAIPGTTNTAHKRGKVKVLRTLLVIAVGFLPSLFSLWILRKSQLRTRAQMRQAAMNLSRTRVRQSSSRPAPGDRYYLEGVGYLIGDISCKFNARSGYIRCAVNPEGPCEGCRYYEPKEFPTQENSD